MAFSIKTFLQISASMIANMRASNRTLSDYNVGSVARVMLEAPAAEIDELYQSYAAGLVEGIPTAIYRSFNFNLLPAKPASGVVTLSAVASQAAPLSIPQGFLVGSVQGAQYATTQPVTVPVGGSVSVLVACTVAGESGNAAAGDVSSPLSPGISVTVANAMAFVNGSPIETDDQRKLRFEQYVQTLARGTVASIEYAAGTAQIIDATTGLITESVTRVTVDESPGYVALFYYNGVGNGSVALDTQVANLIQGFVDPSIGIVPGYRPTGMRVDSTAMSEIPVDVALSVAVPVLSQTATLQAAVAAVVAAAIRGTRSGGILLPQVLQNASLIVAGVTTAEIVSPISTVSCPLSSVLVPGNITVSWL